MAELPARERLTPPPLPWADSRCQSGRTWGLAESERNQARAKQDNTGNGYRQETVRSEFVTHD